MAVVDIAGLEEEGMSRHAAEQRTAAVELLHALLGETDQVAVVQVRVVGMALEMRADHLDAGIGILLEVDPRLRVHRLLPVCAVNA